MLPDHEKQLARVDMTQQFNGMIQNLKGVRENLLYSLKDHDIMVCYTFVSAFTVY